MSAASVKGWIITGVIVWAILFGVNVGGKHYGLSFGKNGVTVHFGE